MKRLTLLCIICCAVCRLFAYDFCVSGLYYDFTSESTVKLVAPSSLTTYDGYIDLEIPATVPYNGKMYSVTCIGENAFSSCKKLKSLKVPSTITIIKEYAFAHCDSLLDIDIPTSVIIIEQGAFTNTAWFKAQPDSLVYINNVLYSTKGIIRSDTTLVVREGTISISPLFCSSSKVTAISLPSSLKYIGLSAFGYCSKLRSVTGGENVEYIGHYAFNGTAWETSLPNGSHYLGKVLHKHRGAIPQDFTIKEGTVAIGSNAFMLASDLTNITLPNSVKYIGDYAFSSCSSLCTITLSENLEYIGMFAFEWCNKLQSISLPNSVQIIERNAFAACESMQSISIGNNLQSIGMAAFQACRSLETIHLPKSFAHLGYSVFPLSDMLQSITIDSDNPFFKSVDGVLYTKNHHKLMAYPCGRLDETYTVLEGVEELHYGAFETNMYLQEIILPLSLVVLGPYSISMCQQLRYIDIPDNVIEIQEWAFSNCQQMDSVRMGKSVNYIGDVAFGGCMSLRVIDCHLPAPCYVGSQALDTGYGMYYGCNTTLIVDKGKSDLFSAADQWRDLYIIERENDIPTSSDDVSLGDIHTYNKHLRDGQLLIIRDGKTYNTMGAEVK